MKRRLLVVLGSLTLVAVMSVVPLVGAGQGAARGGQATTARSDMRTPWGEPDLQGIWYAFEDVPLQRPPQFAGRELLNDAEYAERLKRMGWIDRVAKGFEDSSTRLGRDRRSEKGTDADVSGAYNAVWSPGRDHLKPSRRSSLIVDPPDGRVPAYTPEAQKRSAAFDEFKQNLLQGTPMAKQPGGALFSKRFDPPPSYNLGRMYRPALGPEDRGRSERCLPLTLPAFGGRIYHRIVQSPGYVAIYNEPSGHQGLNRVIPIGAKYVPLPASVRQWGGDSRGRWEGNTLVIETTNFTRRTDYQGSRENLKLTERFTRLDPETIRLEITVEDPTTWVRPWTIRADMGRQSDYENRLYEPACHEGNYGLIGMLSGARAADQAFKDGRGPDPWRQEVLYDELPGIGGD